MGRFTKNEFSAAARGQYAARAIAAQNHPINCTIDITSFVHLAQTEEQVRRHVEYYEDRAGRSLNVVAA